MRTHRMFLHGKWDPRAREWRIVYKVVRTPGLLGRLLGKQATEAKISVRGSGTVWRRSPSFVRCSLDEGVWLSGQWARLEDERRREHE